MNQDLQTYFNNDSLAISTWKNKYAAFGEQTPDDMHKRLAKEFARIEHQYPNPLSKDLIYSLLEKFKYIIPGGSVMATLGTNKSSSLSNCFVIKSPEDSYHSLMQAREQQVHLMKNRGGVGYDLSDLRPRGAKVSNSAGTSTGAASFLSVNSEVTNEVGQGNRRGALMQTIHINHPDVEEFIESKQDLSKITGANISVKVTDKFMKAVIQDDDYILRWPVNDKNVDYLQDECPCKAPYGKLCSTINSEGKIIGYYKRVKAKDLWNKLIHCAWNTAEPGIIFIDNMHKSLDGYYEKYKTISTNPSMQAA